MSVGDEGRPSHSFPLPPEQVRDVVILIHGIRTLAPWQKVLRSVLGSNGIPVIFTNYGYFDLLRFLLPVRYWRLAAIEQVWRSIREVKKTYPTARISFVAHSFGTFILAHILKKEFDFKAHRVVFCGSVVPYRFPFHQFADRFTLIVNEVGTRDFLPALAQSITWGYGSAGSLGFRNSPKIFDRWHNGFRHSDFLTEEFCRKYWVPFLLEGKLTEADADGRQPSLPVRLLNRVSLKYVLLILGGLFLVPWPTPPKFAPLTFSYGGREFTGQAYWNFSLMQLDEKLTREDGGKTSVLVVDGDIYGSPRTKLYVWIFPNPRPLTDRILPKFDSFRNPAPREAIKIDGAEIVHFYIKSDLDTGPVSEITAIRARNAGIGDRKLIIEKDAEGRLANYKFDDNGATRILIGLSSRNEDMKFNETNIRDADYIVFDLKYANGTTGSITVRKNRNDSENIEKAFSAWKNAF